MYRKQHITHTLRNLVPWIVALLSFGSVALLGFAPQLEGRVLPQHDIQQFNGMSRDIRECRTTYGEDPQWTGAMFSGMPAYQINIKYPTQIIKRTADAIQSAIPAPASMTFFAMLAAFVATMLMGMSAWVGIVVGLAYGLSTYFFLIIGAGHITKMWALVYAPVMLGAIHYTLRRNMWVGGALTALFAALEAGANHPQITYYFIFAAAALWLSEAIFAIKERHAGDFAKRTAVLAGAAILAIGANFAPLYYTMQHSSDTTRGGSALAETETSGLDMDYATAWSYGVAESWNMFIPDFMGGDSGSTFSRKGTLATTLNEIGLDDRLATQLPTYWGEQPYTAGPTYVGAVAIFLALLGLILAAPRDRWWIVAAMLVALLMSWGYHAMWFTKLCFDYLPLYNKFRAVSTALVVVEWCVPLLAGMALWQIYRRWEEKRFLARAVAAAAGITAGIALLFAVAGSAMFDFGYERDGQMMSQQFEHMFRSMSGGEEYIAQGMHDELGYRTAEAMAAERGEIMAADGWRTLAFVVITALVLLAALRWCDKPRGWIVGIVALMVVADMLPVNLRYLPHEHFVAKRKMEVKPSKADRKIMADKELGYRVLNLSVSPFNDATTSLFHRSVGGYHGAKMGRYQDLIDRYLAVGSEPCYDMLNTKYIITAEGEVIERTSRYGAAWFVEDVVACDGAAQELDALGECDLRHSAVVAASEAETLPHTQGRGTIALTDYRPNRLRYDYTLDGGSAVAIFSEIYYDKGWHCYVDGVEHPYFRADYLLRGALLPEGTHTVEWHFRAPSWGMTSTITLLCSILILLAVAAVITYCIYEKRKNNKA